MVPTLRPLDRAGPVAALGRTGPGRRLLWLLGALAGGWLLPVVTQAVRADWLLPPVLVMVTASLLRSGRTVVDRLICALALAYPTTCAAGLLLSVWPWHLSPVPVAGLGFTLLTLVAAATGRRPRLPERPRGRDLVALGFALAAAVLTFLPLVRRDLAGRLAMFMHVQDFARHMMIYDTIRLEGGYLFLHKADAVAHTYEYGFLGYPQGGHFVYAVLQNFITSGSAPGASVSWAADFIWLHATGFVLLCLATLWASARVAGPALRTWPALGLCGLVGGYLIFGDPLTVYEYGYPQEITSLPLLAVLVALAVRPLSRTREQILLVGALLVGISFSYYLFLPVAAAVAAAWLVVHRRRVRPHWLFAAVTALVTGVLMAVPPTVNRSADPGTVLLQNGQALGVNGLPLVVLCATVGIALLVLLRRGRRRIAIVGLASLGTAVTFAVLVRLYQSVNHGQSYFLYKVLHEALLIALVLAGAAVAALPRPGPATRWAVPRRVVAVAVAVAVLSFGYFASAGFRFGDPSRAKSQGLVYLSGGTGKAAETVSGRQTIEVFQRYPTADGRSLVVLMGGPWPQFQSTLYVGILRHQYGLAEEFTNNILPWTGDHPVDAIEKLIAAEVNPITVVTDDAAVRAELLRFAATLPAGKLRVVTP